VLALLVFQLDFINTSTQVNVSQHVLMDTMEIPPIIAKNVIPRALLAVPIPQHALLVIWIIHFLGLLAIMCLIYGIHSITTHYSVSQYSSAFSTY